MLVPKPKGGYRLVVDLRELNRYIPHDVYEPPSCDLCLEWLTGKPYRTTADMRWGFHQVLLSERTQKIFTFVTPFGSFAYRRLVMGYINALSTFWSSQILSVTCCGYNPFPPRLPRRSTMEGCENSD